MRGHALGRQGDDDDPAHVVDHGQTIAEGPPAEIKTHPKVLAAYLGQEENGAEA